MSATLSIQEVNGFPVLVCQSQDRREVYEMRRPEAQSPTCFFPKLTVNIEPPEGGWDALEKRMGLRRFLGGDL